MIDVEQLHKSFGAKVAVQEVTFSARDGQITGLLGPNGAGKTTTLRMLYTLLKPDRGRISVDGVDAASQPLEVRRLLATLWITWSGASSAPLSRSSFAPSP